MSSQQGRHLYHLHDITHTLNAAAISKFFRSHLQWKRITLTSRHGFHGFRFLRNLQLVLDGLHEIRFPVSCQEVNIELEAVNNIPIGTFEQFAQEIKDIMLLKRDGSTLHFSPKGSKEYHWRWVMSHSKDALDYYNIHTARLCWRAAGWKEGWTYDHVNCLEPDDRDRYRHEVPDEAKRLTCLLS